MTTLTLAPTSVATVAAALGREYVARRDARPQGDTRTVEVTVSDIVDDLEPNEGAAFLAVYEAGISNATPD